jgi:hypothetical protein
MSESADIRRLLAAWPYNPDDDARIVLGDDERQILQVRTPLGIEQYEMDGRPDGTRPHGAESHLEFHAARLNEAKAESRGFSLSAAECAELFNEGTLYYFRYVRLFQLRDWKRTLRDTSRNLRAFDLLRKYAEREDDQMFLEKWRPYVLRVNATAAAMLSMDSKAHDQALRVVQQAINAIEMLDDLDDDTFKFERERSLMALRELAAKVKRDRPLTQIEKLEKQLRRAIERQEFEKAAELRDKIRAAKAA